MSQRASQSKRLTNAGGYPVIDTEVAEPHSRACMGHLLSGVDHCIARGAGNSIGDSALNDALVISTRGLDRMLSFDETTGVLVAEAGVMLADIATSFAGRGWFLPTTPGTNQITLGGAVASDVHGKNHHVVGSFCQHVLWLDVLTAEEGVVTCSPTQNPDLFHATCGGNGLTGIALTVAVQMMRIPSNWIRQVGIKTRCLEETLQACEQNANYAYSVAWVDPHARGRAMGRGYLMCGDFAPEDAVAQSQTSGATGPSNDPKFRIPVYFPVPVLEQPIWTETINAIYMTRGSRIESIVSTSEFFYPLQAMNLKMFGGGHITYQFVLPYAASRDGFVRIFKKIVESGRGSLISVLKLFGPQKRFPGNISFPIEGYNLGIDFRVCDGMFALFRELDAMVVDHGGRHYLTKDVCLSPETLRRGYGKSVDEFIAVKAKWDPKNRFRSLQSMRLELY
jgi:FAD/FMN-containing dehydrogenase